MDARVIGNLRRGQAQMRDRTLAMLLVERGVLSQNETGDLLSVATAGSFGSVLVHEGRISNDQLQRFSQEMELLESLDTAVEDLTPQEVRQAAREPSSRVGKYVLVDKVGAGGMGEVWRAWDYGLGRWVALKFLRVQDPKLVRRFMREATLLARLAHPNITQVFEVGIHDRKPFLAMEFVDGGSFGGQALERTAAAKTLREAARGVAYAHDQGIVHRDLKPSNLLRSKDGRIFVTDFGLARMREEGGSLTMSGAVLGTPSFMAPEQAQGRDADERTDVYGLGSTLFALVEGRPPFEGELAAEIVQRVANTVAPTLSGASDDLTVVTQKAMERDRRDRYQTATELVEDLERYLVDEPVLAQPLSSVERAWRKIRRRPMMSSVVAVSLALALGVATWGALRWTEFRARRAAERRADVFLDESEKIADEYRRLADKGQHDSRPARAAIEAIGERSVAAVGEAPDYPRALFWQGRWHQLSGRYAEAEATLSEALELDPGYLDARAARARSRLGQLTSTWSADPEAVTSIRGLDFVYDPPPAELEAYLVAAREDFEALPETHDEWAHGRAVLAYLEGRYDESAELLRPIVGDLETTYLHDELLSLAWSALAERRFEEAARYAAELEARGIFDFDARRIQIYAEAGETHFEKAIADAIALRDSHGEGTGMDRFIPFWMYLSEDLERAAAEFTALLGKEPDSIELLLDRSKVFYRMQRFPEALADADRALEIEPGNPEAHYHRGLALGADAEGLEALSRAMELQPDNALYIGQRALARLVLEDYAGSAEDARRAAELEPDYAHWRWALGVALVGREKWAEAEQVISRLLDEGTEDAFLIFQRGRARFGLEDCSGAIADFTAADELEPTVHPDTWAYVREVCGTATDGG